MSKPMSAAAYRAHAAKVNSAASTENVTLKSGAVFELRRPDLLAYVATGRLPQSLLNMGLSAWKAKGIMPAQSESVDADTGADMLIFMREVVANSCVMPRFVQFATQEDEIGAADMLPADFFEIFTWAMQGQGVTGPDGLREFREGPERRTALTGFDLKKQRAPRKRMAKA